MTLMRFIDVYSDSFDIMYKCPEEEGYEGVMQCLKLLHSCTYILYIMLQAFVMLHLSVRWQVFSRSPLLLHSTSIR